MSKMLPPKPGSMPTEPHEQEIAYLARVAEAGCKMTREEVNKVLGSVPLLVLADDDPCMRTVLFRIMTASRKQEEIAALKGDIQQCFDTLPQVETGRQPVILCENGAQAATASQIICDRQIGNGILVFDQKMGSPEGLDIFKKFNRYFPTRIARTLLTGTPPADTEKCLQAGILDAAIIKPPDRDEARAIIAQAYLKRMISGK